MEEEGTIKYACEVCGYQNVWTRDRILQFGRKEIFREGASDADRYSLPCCNPAFACTGRRSVAVKRQE